MTRAELTAVIQERVGEVTSRPQAATLLETTLDLVREALARGEEVKLSGFGLFDVVEKTPRIGRNPQTGAAIMIPGRRIVRYKPSRVLRESMNGGQG